MAEAASARTRALSQLFRRPEAGTLIGLVVVYVVFSVLGGANFIGAKGLSSWLNVAAEVGIWQVDAFFAHECAVVFDAQFNSGR